MLRPASADAQAAVLDRRDLVARAKRTDRTAARRRYRTEQAGLDDASGVESAEPTPTRGRAAQPGPVQPRPGIMASFRNAYRPLDLRGDLRAAPKVLAHWGVWGAILIAVAASIAFMASTNDFAAAIDFSDPNALQGKTLDTASNISYLVISMFIVPPPMAGAFLIGFTAKRASWLGGLVFGVAAAACYAVVLTSPAGKLLTGNQSPDSLIVTAAALSPMGAALFAAAAAWYRRFLDLANPNRGQRRPTRPQQGRGNPRQKDRPLVSRAVERRR
jgi:hypothetical protein